MRHLKSWIKDIFLVYCREFKLVIHDNGIVLFFTFLPLAYPIIYSLIYNPEVVRDVPMVVVDHDRTAESRKLVRSLDACQEVWVKGYAPDLNEARHAMDSRECFAILEIPEGFEKDAISGEQGNAVMYCDMSLMLRYKGFLVAATNVMMDMTSELQIEEINDVMPLATTIANGDPLPIHNIQMGNTQGGFDSFIMPGVVILILHQCIILAVGMLGGAKHENSRLVGYQPINAVKSTFLTMTGQALCYLTIIALPMIFLVHYVPLIFSFPMAGSFLEEALFLLPMMLACVAIGFCLQAVVWERETIFIIWVVTSVAFLFLSGITWPRYAMPHIWKILSDIIPATWGVEGFIQMNTNGATLSQVHTLYTNLWIQTGVYSLIAYLLQRFVVRPSIGENKFCKQNF